MSTHVTRAGVALSVAAAILTACVPPSTSETALSVVRVEALPCGRSGVGSGTVIGDDLVLTNAHVVAGSSDDVTVRTGNDLVYAGVVVGFDGNRDLALVRVDGLDAPTVELGDPEEGMAARIIARPGGVTLEVLETRIVRLLNATGDDIYGEGEVARRAIELEADVVPGASGGGVFTEDGNLVGVVFAESRRRESTSYAVAANEVRSFLQETDVATAADTLRCR